MCLLDGRVKAEEVKCAFVIGALLLGSASAPILRGDAEPRGESNGSSTGALSYADAAGALKRAAEFMRGLSTQGGYVWRYSLDRKERWGEVPATQTQVWVQPPGTPSMGLTFLRAYEVTKDEWYLRAAKDAAMALVNGQLESGGWDYYIDFSAESPHRYRQGEHRDRAKNTTTFDDQTTQSAIRFLMEFLITAPAEAHGPIAECAEYALAKVVEAQYPTGAWPQRYDGKQRDPQDYPIKRATIPEEYPREYLGKSYQSRYTLNDGAQRNCVLLMLEAYEKLGKKQFLHAAEKGGEFLILSQLPPPQAGWAQQYNFDMEPAWARAFEPPALSAKESAGAVQTLIDLYLATGNERYLQPIPAAIEWFERSMLGSKQWARMYELGTNRPIYGDRDGTIHFSIEELSRERREGYGWEGQFEIPKIIRTYARIRDRGIEAYKRELAAKRKTPKLSTELEERARQAIGSMDSQGRWIANEQIETRVFITNAERLCEYMAALSSTAAESRKEAE